MFANRIFQFEKLKKFSNRIFQFSNMRNSSPPFLFIQFGLSQVNNKSRNLLWIAGEGFVAKVGVYQELAAQKPMRLNASPLKNLIAPKTHCSTASPLKTLTSPKTHCAIPSHAPKLHRSRKKITVVYVRLWLGWKFLATRLFSRLFALNT